MDLTQALKKISELESELARVDATRLRNQVIVLTRRIAEEHELAELRGEMNRKLIARMNRKLIARLREMEKG